MRKKIVALFSAIIFTVFCLAFCIFAIEAPNEGVRWGESSLGIIGTPGNINIGALNNSDIVDGELDYLPGDVNSDGVVNGKDVTLIRRYNANWDVDINLLAADVNADGVINGKDVTLIRRFNADYDVELEPGKIESVNNQIRIKYTDNGNGTITAKFSINGNVNVAMIELQLSFELTNADYSDYSILVSDSADANYFEGVFYFSFVSADDVTTETDLFSITFTNKSENIGIEFSVIDSLISDGSFTNITQATVVGTTYNN